MLGHLFSFIYLFLGKTQQWALFFFRGFMDKFYKGKKWLRLRRSILSRDKKRCVLCEKIDGTITEAEMVHHIIPREDTKLLEYDSANLISLCWNCHKKLHGRGGVLSPLGRELVRSFCEAEGYPPLNFRSS